MISLVRDIERDKTREWTVSNNGKPFTLDYKINHQAVGKKGGKGEGGKRRQIRNDIRTAAEDHGHFGGGEVQ